MQVLVDTHALLWWLSDDPALTKPARKVPVYSRALNKDPFDLMLIAQAQAENIPILSSEVQFDTYGVGRLW